jgi:hypothetical protein
LTANLIKFDLKKTIILRRKHCATREPTPKVQRRWTMHESIGNIHQDAVICRKQPTSHAPGQSIARLHSRRRTSLRRSGMCRCRTRRVRDHSSHRIRMWPGLISRARACVLALSRMARGVERTPATPSASSTSILASNSSGFEPVRTGDSYPSFQRSSTRKGRSLLG